MFVAEVASIFFGATLIAGLGLSVGLFLKFTHETKTKGRKRAPYLTLSYVLGAGTMIFLTTAAACFLTILIVPIIPYHIWFCLVLASLLVAGALVIWRYHRPDKDTVTLWLPRPVAKFLAERAENTRSEVEAFSLGVSSIVFELPFSAPVFFATALVILEFTGLTVALPLAFSLAAIFPLILLWIKLKHNTNSAAIHKWRLKHKRFFQVLLGSYYFVFALFLFVFFGGIW